MNAVRRTLWALSALALAAPLPLLAQEASGNITSNSAGGSYAISFSAHGQGLTAGDMSFDGPVPAAADEEVGAPAVSNLTAKVTIDCLSVNLNTAIMTGTVASSNVPDYVGRNVMLTVQEGGRFNYAFTRAEKLNENPSDNEVVGDAGANFTWTATDAERPDDRGRSMSGRQHRANCQTLTSNAAALNDDMQSGNGTVSIHP